MSTPQSLIDIFQPSSKKDKPAQEQLLKDTISLMQKVPAGREALKNIEDLGYNVVFESGIDAGGFCDSDNKVVILSADYYNSAEELSPILVHEMQHAVQATTFEEDFFGTSIASTMKYRFAQEADACAHETAFMYQARQLGIDVAVFDEYENAYKIYQENYEKGDPEKAMNNTFKAWYDEAGRYEWYSKYYADAFVEMGKSGEKHSLKKVLSNKEITDSLLFEGKPYVEPSFLSTPEAFSMTNENKKRIIKATHQMAPKGEKPDASVFAMYTRTKDGKITDKRCAGKQQQLSAAEIKKRREMGR